MGEWVHGGEEDGDKGKGLMGEWVDRGCGGFMGEWVNGRSVGD